jgi:hypothetical protein
MPVTLDKLEKSKSLHYLSMLSVFGLVHVMWQCDSSVSFAIGGKAYIQPTGGIEFEFFFSLNIVYFL